MPRFKDLIRTTWPYPSPELMRHFAKELADAGDLETFLVQKEAINKGKKSFSIVHFLNLREYARIHLTGPYKEAIPQLRKLGNPYSFWLQLYWSHKVVEKDW